MNLENMKFSMKYRNKKIRNLKIFNIGTHIEYLYNDLTYINWIIYVNVLFCISSKVFIRNYVQHS